MATAVDELPHEELELEYEEACNEVADLQSELRAVVLERQQLHMRLQAAMCNAGTKMRPGPAALPEVGSRVIEDQRMDEMHCLLRWLAEHVDLGHTEMFDVGFEMTIGGRTVQLLRIVQWPLPSAFNGQLRLSIPIEHHESLAALLAQAKARGSVARDVLCHFVTQWDLVAGEVMAATHMHAEPSVLLAHYASLRGILVARWPTREILEAFHALRSAGIEVPRIGERVEVEYEGQWYTGVLHSINATGTAGVKCDVDASSVLTVTPIHRLRRLTDHLKGGAGPAVVARSDASGDEPGSPWRPGAGHRRTRSSAL